MKWGMQDVCILTAQHSPPFCAKKKKSKSYFIEQHVIQYSNIYQSSTKQTLDVQISLYKFAHARDTNTSTFSLRQCS